MTDTDWHAPPPVLARYLADPGGLDDMTASSIEAHLVTCAECRAHLTGAADPALIAASWDRVADTIDRPRASFAERLWDRAGIDPGAARLLGATPALRAAALLAVLLLAAGAVLLARGAGSEGPFLVVAPLVPLAAVALAFAPAADPAGEAGVATPLHGAGLVVRRAIAVVGATFTALGVAALALPDLGPEAAAWMLPALALALGSLALATWLRIETAVATLATTWVAVVWSRWWLDGHDLPLVDTATFGAAGQLTAIAVSAVAAALLAVRRDRFATLEAFR